MRAKNVTILTVLTHMVTAVNMTVSIAMLRAFLTSESYGILRIPP